MRLFWCFNYREIVMIKLSSFFKAVVKEILVFLKVGIVACTIFYLIPMTIYAYTQGGVSSSSIDTYTLTNGQKTVVFQSMSHIGLRSFYKEVGEEMTDYRNKGYRILLEGIGSTGYKPLRKGDIGYEIEVAKYNSYYDINKKILDDMDSKSIYKNSKYTYQGIEMSRYMAYDDEYADISYSTLFDLADKKAKEKNINQSAVDAYKDMDFKYSDSTNRLLNNEKLFIYTQNIRNYPIFTFFDNYLPALTDMILPENSLRTEVTINARNQNLVKHIIEEPENFIYLTYGSAHFKGVFDNLKAIDSNWKIVSTTQKMVFGSH